MPRSSDGLFVILKTLYRDCDFLRIGGRENTLTFAYFWMGPFILIGNARLHLRVKLNGCHSQRLEVEDES